VQKGVGVNRRDVMYNDFIIVGPQADPAKVQGLQTAAEALKAIGRAQANFASRGDSSGTHVKEKELWKTASTDPSGSWYASVGQGMGETLGFANEKLAYTLTDRGTWLAQKPRLGNLKIVYGGETVAENKDPALLNPYGVIPVNPVRHPSVKANLAGNFARWITSVETQRNIQAVGVSKFGQSLFRADSVEYKQAR
jgi:tungstate transport system substrate-binding protein